ncbi:MAG: hypothetical protein OEX02_14045 [Cyclobacteriaceae bacterium]|nr:hypothetical protein [Cyclobacteriaceae bacterium]
MEKKLLHQQPRYVKSAIMAFLLALSFGYFAGFKFIFNTTGLKSGGIEENYLGNEDNEEAEVMKFKKSENELITTIHTHAISFSLIFGALGFLLYHTTLNRRLKALLMIEPFISVVLSFGGIWLMWLGADWMKYVVMVSGMGITVGFVMAVLVIIYGLYFRKAQ